MENLKVWICEAEMNCFCTSSSTHRLTWSGSYVPPSVSPPISSSPHWPCLRWSKEHKLISEYFNAANKVVHGNTHTYVSILHSSYVWPQSAVCFGDDRFNLFIQLIELHGKWSKAVHLLCANKNKTEIQNILNQHNLFQC